MIFARGFRLVLIALAFGAFTGAAQAGDIAVTDAWARASIGAGKTGAAYLTATNNGAETDSLVAVETEVAERAELHGHIMDGSVMKMRQVEAVEVDPGTPSVLQPGGLHVMLMGLKAPLAEGESFPLTLTFEKAGEVEVMVKVLSPTAMKGEGMGGMDHSKHGS